METRLDLISPNLAMKLSQVDKEMLRQVAFAACETALEYTDLESPLIGYFREYSRGSTSINRQSLKDKLEDYVAQLDEAQWNLKVQVELGKKITQNFMQAFCNARVINALYYALELNPYIAATESIYEAYAATNDLESLEKKINQILTKTK